MENNIKTFDLCIYGATSGGLVAAMAAKQAGKSAIILEPRDHFGGLSSGGLGETDIGCEATISGLSLEFYRRVGRLYGSADPVFHFEPRIARAAFASLIQEFEVQILFRAPLRAVRMAGRRIASIEAGEGLEVRAAMYLDASYEGDLMAGAGVTSTTGREANAMYGETLNGFRDRTTKHQFLLDVDPYRVPGNPASGLLPHIQPHEAAEPGGGDNLIQAYNYRLCLTNNPGNRLPIPSPAGYDPFEYELLGRYAEKLVEAGHRLGLKDFIKMSRIPNQKLDVNNYGAFSTDHIGCSYDYPEGSPERREEIRRTTRAYIEGLLTYLRTEPRIPQSVRDEMATWGYAADEFQETGGFGHELYVREARRMVADYVLTENDAMGRTSGPNSVGMGPYMMDSHNVQRIVQNGAVRNEGDVQRPIESPYPIPYQAIVPARGECENLLVTFCLSASHMGFGSARMEPVFMMTSQSAALAASLAIEGGLAVQDVPYSDLLPHLRRAGLVLTMEAVDSAG